jgi:hypothetical protein
LNGLHFGKERSWLERDCLERVKFWKGTVMTRDCLERVTFWKGTVMTGERLSWTG